MDPEGRSARHTVLDETTGSSEGAAGVWRVTQMLQDPEGLGDWGITFQVDLAESRAAGTPVLRLEEFGPAG
jgi:hypothetical protein